LVIVVLLIISLLVYLLVIIGKRSRRAQPEIVGVVRQIQWHKDRTRDVCTFRLVGLDEKGGLGDYYKKWGSLQAVTVEIRSRTGFAGDLSPGDRISMYGYKRAARGVFVTSAVRNISTGGIFGERENVDAKRIDVPPAVPSGGDQSPELRR
jgi:hypothetical protein